MESLQTSKRIVCFSTSPNLNMPFSKGDNLKTSKFQEGSAKGNEFSYCNFSGCSIPIGKEHAYTQALYCVTLSCSSDTTRSWWLPCMLGLLERSWATSSGSGRGVLWPSRTTIPITGALCMSWISLAGETAEGTRQMRQEVWSRANCSDKAHFSQNPATMLDIQRAAERKYQNEPSVAHQHWTQSIVVRDSD